MRNYLEGSVILKQGEIAKEVFTMADGFADIMVDDRKIGSIMTDTVFGLLSAFTETPSIASVIASSDCLVLSLSKDSYIELILSRPQVVKDLIKNMAHLIVSGDKQLAGNTLKL